MKSSERRLPAVGLFAFAFLLAWTPYGFAAQTRGDASAGAKPPASQQGETTQSLNARLAELAPHGNAAAAPAVAQDYRIGPEDLVSISVFETPELAREVRVSAEGQISVPLIGEVHAAGLTTRQLEAVLEELLRRTYMKDPHVSVFVKEMQSHPVSVFGAVKKPGVFQVRTGRSLIEVLSLAEGLAEDAGDTVILMRHDVPGGPATGPADSHPAARGVPTAASDPAGSSPASATALAQTQSLEIDLRNLLSSGDPRFNVMVYPGDVVKVTRAGIVYVVGEVSKPGGYLLKTNENVSILQALALAGGLTRTSAGGRARIIRTETATGARRELPINLGRILHGKDPDQMLQAKDIVFIPNSAGKAALYHGTDGIVAIVGSALIYRY